MARASKISRFCHAKLEEAEAALREAEEKSRDKLAQLAQSREAAAEAVPPKALDTFNRVAKKHEGEAMAQVILEN
jgi:predicted  nucleic acid-binding Zn-ribbon protein